MLSLAISALAEGHELKAAKAEQLKAILKGADLVKLLKTSPTKPIVIAEKAAK